MPVQPTSQQPVQIHISGDYVDGNKITVGDISNSSEVVIGRGDVPHDYPITENQSLYVNVPSKPNYVLGRDTLIEKIINRLLSDSQLSLSLEGLPGVGKTTLAIAIADNKTVLSHFKDGVLWASLGPNPNVRGQLNQWAGALYIDLENRVNLESCTRVIKDAIGQRHILLIIDDVWDIEAANALRCGGPNASHLITTRDKGIARSFSGTSQVENLSVLDKISAFEFLNELAPEVCDLDLETSQALVKSVGYLPLAIQLLGGYLATPEHSYFPSYEAFENLQNPKLRLQLAQQRIGVHTTKEITLEETINLSIDMLPKEAASTFYALGAFAPKPEVFDSFAAETIAQTDLATLSILIAHNLVEHYEERQLAIHPTLADVARTQTEDTSIRLHRDYYLEKFNENQDNSQNLEILYGQIRWAWLQQVELGPEDEDILKFISIVSTYQRQHNLWDDRLAWQMQGLKYARNKGNHGYEAKFLNNIGLIHSAQGNQDKALSLYKEALGLSNQVGDQKNTAVIFSNIGLSCSALEEKESAINFYEGALTLFYDLGDRKNEAIVLNKIGSIYINLDNKEYALKLYQDSLAIRKEIGDIFGEAITLNNIGWLYASQNKNNQALECYENALRLMSQIGDKQSQSTIYYYLSEIYIAIGNIEKAQEQIGNAIELAELIKSPNITLYRGKMANIQMLLSTSRPSILTRIISCLRQITTRG